MVTTSDISKIKLSEEDYRFIDKVCNSEQNKKLSKSDLEEVRKTVTEMVILEKFLTKSHFK